MGLIGLAITAALTACGDEEAAPSTPSLTPSFTANPTSAASPSPTARREASSGLGEALAGGEFFSSSPLAKPILIYALKEGRHVTIFQRNLMTGEEQVMIEYDEWHEAKHSGNLWEEQWPSAALSDAENLIVYIDEGGVIGYDVSSGVSRTILRKDEGTPVGELARYRWLGDSGAELCCAFDLVGPVVSEDGSWVTVPMTQYEGDSLGVFDGAGAKACVVDRANSLNSAWGPQGDLLVPGDGGEYGVSGLFVAPQANPCAAVEIADAPQQYFGGYSSGDWSADGRLIATSLVEGEPEPVRASLRLISRDGSENRVLLEDGFNFWPTFDPSEQSIYFVRRLNQSRGAEESLWRYDLAAGSAAVVQSVASGWSLRSPSWTAEGYLAFRAHSTRDGCYYWSCENRLVILDPESGNVLYASAPRDFTNYLGFLP